MGKLKTMKTAIIMTTILVILNIFMYVGVNFSISAEGNHQLNKDYAFHFEGDLIDSFMSGKGNLNQITANTKDNWTSYGVGFNNDTAQIPSQQSGVGESSGINFLDSLKIGWQFVLMLGNVMIAPLTLFFNFRMPVFIGLMIGIPYFTILLLTMFAYIRGVGD